MKRKIILICCLASALQSMGQFRVVGYVSIENGTLGFADRIPFSKLTHLNIAFVNPDSSGNFRTIIGLDSIINRAHANHVKVLMSIGGGSAPVYYAKLLNDKNRAHLISNILQFATQNKLDGVDVDLEGDIIDSHYEVFVSELRKMVKLKQKLLTAAVATSYTKTLPHHALEQFDFINIMSYDETGPWTPDKPGPHAPYQVAVDDISHWKITRGIAKEKLCLGVPFYGYKFGPKDITGLSFSDIIKLGVTAKDTDSFKLTDGGTVYYNGIPTIKKKTSLALKQTGGIMIWEIFQDADGANSLLSAINEVISRK
jgi:chitinase